MKMYILSDGWPAYQQPDGTLTDTPSVTGFDLSWDSLDQIKQWDEDVREATLEERKHYAQVRYNHRVWIGEV